MNWSYLAAFTDADGCIHMSPKLPHGYNCKVEWYQCERDSFVLIEIQLFLTKHGIHSGLREYKPGHFCVYVQRQDDVIHLLMNLRDKLIVKENKAETVLNRLKSLRLDRCQRCGTEMSAKTSKRKWCSGKCATAAHREKVK